MKVQMVFAAGLCLLPGVLRAAEPATESASPATAAAELGRCLDDSAIAIGYVDAGRFDAVGPLKKGAAFLHESPFGPVNGFAASIEALHVSGAKQIYAVFTQTSQLDNRSPYFVALTATAQEAEAISSRLAGHSPFQSAAPIGTAVVAGSRLAVERLQKREPVARRDLGAALAAADAAAVSLLIVPSADQRRALEEILPELPPQIGGGPTSVLTRGLQWAAIKYDPERKVIDLVVRSQDSGAARALQEYLRNLPGKAAGVDWLKTLFPNGRLPDKLVPAVKDDSLMLTVGMADAVSPMMQRLLGQTVSEIRRPAMQLRLKNHLRQMALAMHNFLDVHKSLPAAAIYDNSGRPLLSWRVQLLPWLEYNGLYKEFHLDEPWDSEHNKKLIPRIPDVFRADEAPVDDPGKTTMLGVVGKQAFFHGRQGIRINDVTDGTSMTIMLVNVPPKDAVIWTKPEDFDADQSGLKERLLGGREGFWIAFCDGSARFLSASVTENTLRALMTINGGEIIQADELQ